MKTKKQIQARISLINICMIEKSAELNDIPYSGDNEDYYKIRDIKRQKRINLEHEKKSLLWVLK